MAAAACSGAPEAGAQDRTARLEALLRAQQDQIEALRRDLSLLRRDQARTRREAAARPAPGQPTPSQKGAPSQVAAGKDGDRLATLSDLTRFVERGAKPLSFLVPGTDVSLRIGGYAKADVIARVGGDQSLGSQDLFVTANIDTRGTRTGDDTARFHARESRVFIEASKAETPFGPARAYIEGDFFGAGGNQLTSNSDAFRLRHAIAEVGPILAGQWWSTFSDPSAYAETLDFQGTNGETFIRQGLVRYEHKLAGGLAVAIAAENPEGRAQLTPSNVNLSTRDTFPDLVARLRYDQPWGHVQVAGLLTKTNAPQSRFDDQFGGAGTVTGLIKVPALHSKDNVRFTATYAVGAARYIQDTAQVSASPSVFYNPITVQSEQLRAFGGHVALQHWWTDTLRSNAVFGYVQADNPRFASPAAFRMSQYAALNLIWSPFPEVDVDVEGQWGSREDEDGQKGSQQRLQSSLKYKF